MPRKSAEAPQHEEPSVTPESAAWLELPIAQRVALALREGMPLRDDQFDRLYDDTRARFLSSVHWSAVDVCLRAATLLSTGPGSRILDIGSGAGKFCIIGALSTPGIFTGVEQRSWLVELASEVARQTAAVRAEFIVSDAFDLDWTHFTGFYFFNPFAEQLFQKPCWIDDTLEFSRERYELYVAATRERLARLASGTRVVIYHELGCEMPAGYTRVLSEWCGGCVLELWVKE